jgi:hypothetical protein
MEKETLYLLLAIAFAILLAIGIGSILAMIFAIYAVHFGGWI